MKKIFYLLACIISFTSCSSDDDATGNPRDIKYEITGNFSGELDVAYITASGGATSTEVTSLPWDLSFTAESQSSGAGFNAGGIGGTQGETISLKIYQGDQLKGTTNAVADSDGTIVAVSPTVTF